MTIFRSNWVTFWVTGSDSENFLLFYVLSHAKPIIFDCFVTNNMYVLSWVCYMKFFSILRYFIELSINRKVHLKLQQNSQRWQMIIICLLVVVVQICKKHSLCIHKKAAKCIFHSTIASRNILGHVKVPLVLPLLTLRIIICINICFPQKNISENSRICKYTNIFHFIGLTAGYVCYSTSL